MPLEQLEIRGARVHNLKGIDLDLPHNQLIVVTGVSGSGKSSLVFHLVYAEGRRRYIEALSSYARQFLERIDRPDADSIVGVSPTVALRQKNTTRNPRSTVATTTEIADFLRLLFARVGHTHCRKCGDRVTPSPVDSVTREVCAFPEGSRWYALFPAAHAGYFPKLIPSRRRAVLKERFSELRERGFNRLYQDGKTAAFSAPESLLDLDLAEQVWVVADRIAITSGIRERVAEAVESAYRESGRIQFLDPSGQRNPRNFLKGLSCDRCQVHCIPPEPSWFSLDTGVGSTCSACRGDGTAWGVTPEMLVVNHERELAKAAIPTWEIEWLSSYKREMLEAAANAGIPVNVPFGNLSLQQQRFILYGGDGYAGALGFIEEVERGLHGKAIQGMLTGWRSRGLCRECHGQKFAGRVRRVKVGGKSIADVMEMDLAEAQAFFRGLQFEPAERPVARRLLREIRNRLRYLVDVGLHYLTLDRRTMTLSGGEAQRIQLAGSLGSKLVGVSYVLDEPSIGLHCRDISRLVRVLRRLRDLGNTIFVVEHDAEIMRAADYIVDLGPMGGERGGEVMFAGPFEELGKNGGGSKTGRYLSGAASIPVPAERRQPTGDPEREIEFVGAMFNNLKSISGTIPLGMLVAITGVSGSGKSTLLEDVIYDGLSPNPTGWRNRRRGEVFAPETLPAPIKLDQASSDLGSRSIPATFIGVYDDIRSAFARTAAAHSLGLTPSDFSFNVEGGRCPECKGTGRQKVEMQFLADVELVCDECDGRQFRDSVLTVKYRGKSIRDVLDLTVEEALRFFAEQPRVRGGIEALADVGLGYLRLGQRASELSGGEVQRMRLAQIATKRDAEGALLLFDEPTTGLHFADIERLLGVFDRMVEDGATVVVVEHHLDVIKCADWVIDLGPEGGEAGGEIVAMGPPEVIARCERSRTGRYLREVL